MSNPTDRVEIITSVQRRRRWTASEKVRIVEETFEPGMTVSLVARRHGDWRSDRLPARDQTAHARRGRVPRRAIGPQSRRGQASAHRRHRVVDQEIPEYRAAEGPADER